MCFANAVAKNCSSDVADTVVAKLQESVENELTGLKWGGDAEVGRLKSYLRG